MIPLVPATNPPLPKRLKAHRAPTTHSASIPSISSLAASAPLSAVSSNYPASPSPQPPHAHVASQNVFGANSRYGRTSIHFMGPNSNKAPRNTTPPKQIGIATPSLKTYAKIWEHKIPQSEPSTLHATQLTVDQHTALLLTPLPLEIRFTRTLCSGVKIEMHSTGQTVRVPENDTYLLKEYTLSALAHVDALAIGGSDGELSWALFPMCDFDDNWLLAWAQVFTNTPSPSTYAVAALLPTIFALLDHSHKARQLRSRHLEGKGAKEEAVGRSLVLAVADRASNMEDGEYVGDSVIETGSLAYEMVTPSPGKEIRGSVIKAASQRTTNKELAAHAEALGIPSLLVAEDPEMLSTVTPVIEEMPSLHLVSQKHSADSVECLIGEELREYGLDDDGFEAAMDMAIATGMKFDGINTWQDIAAKIEHCTNLQSTLFLEQDCIALGKLQSLIGSDIELPWNSLLLFAWSVNPPEDEYPASSPLYSCLEPLGTSVINLMIGWYYSTKYPGLSGYDHTAQRPSDAVLIEIVVESGLLDLLQDISAGLRTKVQAYMAELNAIKTKELQRAQQTGIARRAWSYVDGPQPVQLASCLKKIMATLFLLPKGRRFQWLTGFFRNVIRPFVDERMPLENSQTDFRPQQLLDDYLCRRKCKETELVEVLIRNPQGKPGGALWSCTLKSHGSVISTAVSETKSAARANCLRPPAHAIDNGLDILPHQCICEELEALEEELVLFVTSPAADQKRKRGEDDNGSEKD
ncbi:hypothetical protein BOTBODRAFT_188795 [Botryobasidium botryosum FD-172 SS1]|uniref:Uncharacterized protein n=1 Tax=Botryobasidium botryosum (strain FD-172 SS1) TaxID=930990 RepID=A0A067MBS7_BOTB1|nr:hypothetical protein BOTBODRAFT_188795 [Botryobasidium botryosum FD-172 SS1]